VIFSCEVKYNAKNLFGSETKMLSEIKRFFFCSEKIFFFFCKMKNVKRNDAKPQGETKNVMQN
jgi:hypothetical protein